MIVSILCIKENFVISIFVLDIVSTVDFVPSRYKIPMLQLIVVVDKDLKVQNVSTRVQIVLPNVLIIPRVA